MALKLRLSRAGSKKRPYYHVVVAENRAPRDGRFIEKLGSYNPLLPKDSDERVKLQAERIKYWLGVGALPTDRVARFLGEAKIIPMPEQRNNPEKAKPKEKAQERMREKEEKAKAAEEAANQPAEEAPAEAAAPAEDTASDAAPAEAPTETPAEAPAEEPAAEAPAEESKAEEAPAEEASSEESAADEEKKGS